MTSGLFALALLALTGRAQAQHRAAIDCRNPRIVVDPNVDPRWQPAIERLCEELDEIKDADPAVGLRIEARQGDIVLEASLPDGRAAQRVVSSPSSLRVTVLGLVTLPPESSTPPQIAAPPAPTPVLVPEPEPEPVPPRHEPAPPPQARVASSGVEVSASAVGRVAGKQGYLSTGFIASAGVHASSWLLALSVGWDPFETVTSGAPPGFEMENVGAGFVVSRRIGTAPAFDVGAMGLLVEQAQSFTGPTGEITKEQTEVRLGVLGRALLGRGSLRPTLTLEAELSPSRLRRDIKLDDVLPPLPSFTLGIGFGATWEDD